MNLVGHLACAEDLSAAGQVGALLPDLLSLFSRRVKTRPLLAAWREAPLGRSPEGLELARGIEFHETVDKHFHHSALFNDCSRALRETLHAASDEPGLKRMLPAHVLTELYLDHCLVTLAPERETLFYRLLGERGELIVSFAVADARVEAALFSDFIGRLGSGGFLDDYGSVGGILWRMNRILRRMGQRELGPAEQAAVQAEFDARRPALESDLLKFVTDMRHLVPADGLGAPDAPPVPTLAHSTPGASPRDGGQTQAAGPGPFAAMAS